jgi:NADPH:quinone reductase-like Zn-dependent oxidoreductase
MINKKILNAQRSFMLSAAIQLAKLSGFSPIITTASLHNEQLLKSLGATYVLDRKAPVADLPAAVKAITKEPVKVVYDILCGPDTEKVSYHSILAPGGVLVIGPRNAIEESQRSPEKQIVEVFGDPEMPSQRETGVGLYRHLTALLESGEIKVRLPYVHLDTHR